MPHDGDIDYSSFSDAELFEALAGINSKIYPENYRRLNQELLSRNLQAMPSSPTQVNLARADSPSRAPVPRPIAIKAAVPVLAVALVIGVGLAIPGLRRLPDSSIALGLVYGIAAFNLWILYKIWTGRNWARILFSAMFALGMLQTVPALISNSLPDGSVGIALLVVQVAALVAIFCSPSNRWFREVGV